MRVTRQLRRMLLAAGLVGLTAAGAAAQTAQQADPVLGMLEKQVESFLEEVGAGNVQAAYTRLLENSPLEEQEEAYKTLVDSTTALAGRCGAHGSAEKLLSKKVGDGDLILLRYLEKCEKYPVVWYFAFYRPPAPDSMGSPMTSQWRVICVRFDTELESLAR